MPKISISTFQALSPFELESSKGYKLPCRPTEDSDASAQLAQSLDGRYMGSQEFSVSSGRKQIRPLGYADRFESLPFAYICQLVPYFDTRAHVLFSLIHLANVVVLKTDCFNSDSLRIIYTLVKRKEK